MRDFEHNLACGHMGERLVSAWLRSRGVGVIPSYNFAGDGDSKAPRLMLASGGLVIPDIDACRDGRRFWCEVKTYRRAVENHSRKCLVHAIKARLWRHYLEVEARTGCPVFLLLLELDTGVLLSARLSQLQWWPCQCGPCARGGIEACRASEKLAPKRGRYFRRDDMTVCHQFSDADMAPLRAVWLCSDPSQAEAAS